VLDGRRYHVGTARSSGVRPETVLVLTPVRSQVRTSLEAMGPVLAVAVATLAVLVPVGLVATARLARRIMAVERHVATIAQGRFGERLTDTVAGRRTAVDDIGRLVAGVNHLSGTLSDLRTSLVAGERQRLLGQLAAGFAHELRNAVTGAKLAIELHRRRCPATDERDQSLAVAIRQLDILEEAVRGLLTLGRPSEAAAGPVDLATLVGEVRDLTGARCDHAGVSLVVVLPPVLPTFGGRRDALRAALVNLALNAIDAAGRHGHVRIAVEPADRCLHLVVEDDGSGPPASLADSLTEPFVTGKQEGVGLGLAVARAVAEEHGGRLSWSRRDGRTRFVITVPLPGGNLSPESWS